MPDFLETLVFGAAGGLFAWFLALGHLALKNKEWSSYTIAALWFCIGVLLFHFGYENTGRSIFFINGFLEPSLNFILGPLAYFYFQKVFDPAYQPGKKNLIHLLPGGIAFIVLLVAYLIQLFISAEVSGSGLFSVIKGYMYILSNFWMLAYFSLFLRKHYRIFFDISARKIKIFRIMLFLVFEIVVIAFFLLLGNVLHSQLPFKIASVLLTQFLLTVYILSQRYPEYFQTFTRELSKVKYEHSKIKGLDLNAAVQRITDLMDIEEIYMDDELTLKKMSQELSLTSHQLSQILNEQMQTNFRAFLSQYRLKAARELLLKNKDMTVLAVAFSVGFKSKSVFNALFKKEIGVSPTAFRNTNS